MHLVDLPNDVLTRIACQLPHLKDRLALAHTSTSLRTASRSSPWWPRRLRVTLPRDLQAFTAWLLANNSLARTTHLRLRVGAEQLFDPCNQWHDGTTELPRGLAYDGGRDFRALMRAVVTAMPSLDSLWIKAPRGTLFLHVGALHAHPSLRHLSIEVGGNRKGFREDIVGRVPERWKPALTGWRIDEHYTQYWCELRGLTRLPPTLESFSMWNVLFRDLPRAMSRAPPPRLSHLGIGSMLGFWTTTTAAQASCLAALTSLTSLDLRDALTPAWLYRMGQSVRALTIGHAMLRENPIVIGGNGDYDVSLSRLPGVVDLTVYASELKVLPAEMEAVRRLRRLTTISVKGMHDLIPRLTNLTSLEMIDWQSDDSAADEDDGLPEILQLPASLVEVTIHGFLGYFEPMRLDLSACGASLRTLELAAIDLEHNRMFDGIVPIHGLSILRSLRHLTIVDSLVNRDMLWHVPRGTLTTLNLANTIFHIGFVPYVVDYDLEVLRTPT